jgi:hypothetical protein
MAEPNPVGKMTEMDMIVEYIENLGYKPLLVKKKLINDGNAEEIEVPEESAGFLTYQKEGSVDSWFVNRKQGVVRKGVSVGNSTFMNPAINWNALKRTIAKRHEAKAKSSLKK